LRGVISSKPSPRLAASVTPGEAEDRVARGGVFNRATALALAAAGVQFQTGAAGPPNLVVNAQGTLGLLTGRVAVRFASPPTTAQLEVLSRRDLALGPPRFGTKTVFVVTTTNPLGFAGILREESIDYVDVEIDVLYPVVRPDLTAPAAAIPADYWTIIGRDEMLSGTGATIGVIDAGFQEDHPSLKDAWDRDKARVITYDSVTNTIHVDHGIVPDDSSSHGVSVASVAAGSVVPDPEPPGVAAGALMSPVSLRGASSSLLFSTAIEALIELGVGTIVCSIHLPGGDVCSPVVLPAACGYAEMERRVIVWAALERVQPRRDHWIGKFETVVLVAGVKVDLGRLPGTTEVNCVAPGTNIRVAVNMSAYGNSAGHSLAAPMVAAAIALAKRDYPTATAGQLRMMLAGASCQSASEASGPEYGSGIINIRRLLEGNGHPCPI